MDAGLLSIISASCGQLVEMPIALEPYDMVYLDQILHTCLL